MNQTKTIALVEWNWSGHHPTYFNHFIMAMEELGMDVLAVCPDPEDAERTANQTRLGAQGSVQRRGCTQFRKAKYPDRRFNFLRPARISAIDWAVRHFTGIEKQVRGWMRETGHKVDAIYYACVHDLDFEWMTYARHLLQFPWFGHYMHAPSYRMPGNWLPGSRKLPNPQKIFSNSLCKGISILDEGIATQVSESIGKPVVVLPELADERLATDARDQILGERLKSFAAGRPIVGLFGHLLKSKGLMTFLEAARQPAASEICFALGGEMGWYSFPAEARDIQSALARSSNIWTHLARIPGEPGLNYLMAACDAIFAAYLDFPHSSGIQTKAAVLKKPLIVSDGYLMAERTRRFNMGEVIPQGDATALLEAINKITKDPVGWAAAHKPMWAEYYREHSFERFKSNLGELLAFC